MPEAISRREALLVPAAMAGAAMVAAAPRRMTLAIHQTTLAGAGYQKSLEACSKAGVRNVEPSAALIDEFLKTNSLAAARRVLDDGGLTAVQGNTGVAGLFGPNPDRRAAIDNLKRRCEMFSGMGINKVYVTTGTAQKISQNDYAAAPEQIREVGDIARGFGHSMRIEFQRSSTFISTLPTVLRLTREAAHPAVAPMLDCYHFWSGLNKFDDLDLIRPGEIAHVHFQDVPDMPRELLDNSTRIIPGDGVSPLTRILGKLAEKGYSGALSVELFLPKFQQGDPLEVVSEIRRKAEAVMRRAHVA